MDRHLSLVPMTKTTASGGISKWIEATEFGGRKQSLGLDSLQDRYCPLGRLKSFPRTPTPGFAALTLSLSRWFLCDTFWLSSLHQQVDGIVSGLMTTGPSGRHGLLSIFPAYTRSYSGTSFSGSVLNFSMIPASMQRSYTTHCFYTEFPIYRPTGSLPLGK